MIPRDSIVEWGVTHPWPEFDQIEQDLLLSKSIIEISNDEILGDELALRGGTAFHKLFLPKPFRYSEDLDYVRTTEGGVGEIMTRLTELGTRLGFNVKTRFGKYPKVIWRFTSESGLPGKIKIEINTFERSPMYGFDYIEHDIQSSYYTSKTSVKTFKAPELVASKIRALYQRSKGRDLYDIWLALTEYKVEKDKVLKAFPLYKPDALTSEILIENVNEKLQDPQFLGDMKNLVRHDAPEYNPQEAWNEVRELIELI